MQIIDMVPIPGRGHTSYKIREELTLRDRFAIRSNGTELKSVVTGATCSFILTSGILVALDFLGRTIA